MGPFQQVRRQSEELVRHVSPEVFRSTSRFFGLLAPKEIKPS